MSTEILARLEQNHARARQLAEARQAVVDMAKAFLRHDDNFFRLEAAVRALEKLEAEHAAR